jgi:hypothetical protein
MRILIVLVYTWLSLNYFTLLKIITISVGLCLSEPNFDADDAGNVHRPMLVLQVLANVKGHSCSEGNDCADERVQWGEDGGPYSRFKKVGGEGRGRFGPVEKDEKELGGAAVAGGNNIAAGGATDEGARGSPEQVSGG